MSTVETLHYLDIVGLLYLAATDPAKWQSFLVEAARFFGAQGANILHIDTRNPGQSVSTLVGYDHISIEVLLTMSHKVVERKEDDPRIAFGLLHPNKPFRCTDVMPKKEFHATSIYQEFLQPYGIEYTLMVQYSNVPEILTCLALFRGPEQQPFSCEDCTALNALVPHLRRVMAIQKHIFVLDQQRQAAYAVLEAQPTAMLITRENGHIESMNRAARALVDLADGLDIKDNRIAAPRRSDQLAVHLAIRRVANGGTHEPFLLERPSGRSAFQCLVTRIAPSTLLGLPKLLAHSRVALYLSNPDEPLEISTYFLQRIFRLTATEGRVLERIVAGRTPDQTAADLGIAVSTIRSHLSSVFAKTGAGTQAALVQKVLLSPLWIARPIPSN